MKIEEIHHPTGNSSFLTPGHDIPESRLRHEVAFRFFGDAEEPEVLKTRKLRREWWINEGQRRVPGSAILVGDLWRQSTEDDPSAVPVTVL